MADLTDISDPVYPTHGDPVSGPAYPGPPPPPSQPLTERYWYDADMNGIFDIEILKW